MSNLLNTIVRFPTTYSKRLTHVCSCSLACFKLHKPAHEGSDATAPNTTPKPSLVEIPQPPPPAPIPKYLRQKVDWSVLASNPKFAELLKTYPSLLPALQRVYAKTIEPDPEDQPRSYAGNFRGGNYRGRGRGRGDRGRGRGDRFRNDDTPRRWTEKKGDADAMRMLKKTREQDKNDEEKEAMAAFVSLIEEVSGEGTNPEGGVGSS